MSLLTLTLSAMLLSSTQAARCGSMSLIQCTDSACSQNCQTVELDPSACGGSSIDTTVVSGTVAASCDRYSLKYKFYPTDNCIGDKNREEQAFYFD
jgi:hypothetical protein